MNEEIYHTFFNLPRIGKVKVYSNEDDWKKISDVMTFFSKEGNIYLPEKVAVAIIENNLAGLFAWSGNANLSTFYSINGEKINHIKTDKTSELMKRIIKYEKEGWEFYQKNKSEENFNRYCTKDFMKGSQEFSNVEEQSIYEQIYPFVMEELGR